MKLLFAIAVAAVSTVALGDPGQAQYQRYEGPWCMHMTLGRGAVQSRCDMRSYEMCRAEMGGLGGTYCTENPYYKAPAERVSAPRAGERKIYRTKAYRSKTNRR